MSAPSEKKLLMNKKKGVAIPVKESAFLTQHQVRDLIDPTNLNCGELTSIYERHLVDFEPPIPTWVQIPNGDGDMVTPSNEDPLQSEAQNDLKNK